MILYRPTDGDVLTTRIDIRPRTCFVMTQLGQPLPPGINEIQRRLTKNLENHRVSVIDANSVVTGRDFLLKVWSLIIGVPLGVAIISKEMTSQTYSNVFYELGLMQAYGKETLVIKTEGTTIPSDFVRTEYLEFNNNFDDLLEKYLHTLFQQAEYYAYVADQLENNPLLAIDYLRRAYLITGKVSFRKKAREVFEVASFQGRAKNSVEMLLVDF